MAGSTVFTRLQSALIDVVLTIFSIVAWIARALVAIEEIFAVPMLARVFLTIIDVPRTVSSLPA